MEIMRVARAIVVTLICFLLPAISSHAEMAMPGPGAMPSPGGWHGPDTQEGFLGWQKEMATGWNTGMGPNTIDVYLLKYENYARQLYDDPSFDSDSSWEFLNNVAIAEAANRVNRAQELTPHPYAPPEITEEMREELMEWLMGLMECRKNRCAHMVEEILRREPPRQEPPKPCDPRLGRCPYLDHVTLVSLEQKNACPEEEAQQVQFIKETMLRVVVRELDLHDAVSALNACGLRSPRGSSWSTVELLDLLIPDDVTNPEMFALIVVENFRSRDGWPIAFEAGDSRCTIIRRSDLTCEFR